jgi:hypothetical protein
MSEPLTLHEAAKYIGLPESQLRIWADMNAGPTFTGNPYRPDFMRYRRDDLDAWLEEAKRFQNRFRSGV